MFLSVLSRKEKLKFLDIAIYMVDIDGEATLTEKKILSKIFGEVGRSIVDEYTFSKSEGIEETIEYLKECNAAVKNIVFLNLAKISMEDDLYNTCEHLFLERLEKEFSITTEKRRELMNIVYEERDLRERARRVIKY